MLRDTGFVLLAAWLVVRPRTLFALDSRLTDARPTGTGRRS
jgi:hypothetical protein